MQSERDVTAVGGPKGAVPRRIDKGRGKKENVV